MLATLHRPKDSKHRFLAPSFLLLTCAAVGILALLAQSRTVSADTLCVKPGGGGGCYASIDTALSTAQISDTIRVAMGVYSENVLITKTVTLQGGWNLDFTQRDPNTFITTIRPADPLIAVVTVQGQFSDWAAVAPTIDGFTITGARSDNHGGGLRMNDSNAVVSHNVITDNTAYLLGGGVWVQRGAPLFESNRIENNLSTGNGGGIELEGTQATLAGNIIASNVVTADTGYGGGIFVDGGGPVLLAGNSILSNSITSALTMTLHSDVASILPPGPPDGSGPFGAGGGVGLENATAILSNNLVQGNVATEALNGYGGGVFAFTSVITLSHNILQNNVASTDPDGPGDGYGGGLLAEQSTVSLSHDTIQGNTARIGGGYYGGLGMIQSQVSLDAVRILNNQADFVGGAEFTGSSYYTMTNGLVANNIATTYGGLQALDYSDGTLVNNTFVSNGDAAITSDSSLTVTNNIIMSHTVGISFNQPIRLSPSVNISPTITTSYNDFWANYTNTVGLVLDPTDLILDPQLTPDYHLSPTSPMVDAGTRSGAPEDDIDGEPRPMAGSGGLFKVDIGADELTGTPQTTRHLATDPADFTLIGPGNPQDNPNSDGSNDWIGYSVLGGDVNGDNRDDLFSGAANLSDDFDGGVNDSGRVFGLYNNGTRRTGITDLLTDTASLEVRSWIHQQHIGQALAAADLNGDGARDFIIGSVGGDNNGTPITGTVFVFAGGPDLAGTRTLSPTMQADWRFKSGESTESFAGRNALAAGQLNSSGPDDLVVGEALATGPGNRSHSGAVYVFFGSSSLPPLWDLGTMPASLTIYGPANESQLGKVAIADVNGDSQPDLVARSEDSIYVFFGPLASGTIDLATTPADATITNAGGGWLAVGEVNGDGKDDIVVSTATDVHLILGGSLPATQTLSEATLASYTGVNASALRVADWNGDGKGEVLMGESTSNRVFIIFDGASQPGAVDIFDRANWIVYGESQGDQFGYSLGSGDLDADGVSDLILGSRSHNVDDHPTHFEDAGAVYVLYGARGQPGATPTPTGVAGTPTACTILFTDVPQGSTFYPYVRCLACLGILNGYDTGCETGNPCFRPNNNVTRGQLAKIVSNAAGFTDPPGAQIFEDVAPGSTFYDFVQRLASRGYMSGYPCGGAGEPCGPDSLPYFRPSNNATRGQTAKIVSNTFFPNCSPPGR